MLMTRTSFLYDKQNATDLQFKSLEICSRQRLYRIGGRQLNKKGNMNGGYEKLTWL
jgi:hypothetical protein